MTPPAQRAGVLGVLVAVHTLPGLIGPAVTGWIIGAGPTAADGYRVAFTVGAVVMLGCGLFALLAIRPDRDAVRLGLRP